MAKSPLATRVSQKTDLPINDADFDAGVRVLCVDDHAVLVEGLRSKFSIENRIRIVGHLLTADRLLEEVGRLKPDLVLLDIEMPGADVFEMADRMHRKYPGLRFVFFSAHIRDGYLANVYKCGAWGYFAKGDDLDDIVDGIKELARSKAGAFIMGPKVRQRCGVARPALSPEPSDTDRPQSALAKLSSREVEILHLIGKGLSRIEIGKQLSRSAKTIDGHQERMMKKLRINSRADLIRFAIREGFAEA